MTNCPMCGSDDIRKDACNACNQERVCPTGKEGPCPDCNGTGQVDGEMICSDCNYSFTVP